MILANLGSNINPKSVYFMDFFLASIKTRSKMFFIDSKENNDEFVNIKANKNGKDIDKTFQS